MYKIGSMPSSIQIGFVGETNFRTIEIDMTAWMEKMPAGIPSIIHVRPGETKAQAYIAATDFDEETNVLSWPITAGDIGILEGEGEMQVWLEETADEETTKRGKSVKVITVVNDSANEPDATPPEAQAAYMEQMTALKMATVEAAEDAAEAKTDAEAAQAAAEQAATDAENVNLHPAYIDSTTKHWMVYDATQHQYVDTEIIAEGQAADVIDDTTPALNKTFSSAKVDEELTDVKSAIQGVEEEIHGSKTPVDVLDGKASINNGTSGGITYSKDAETNIITASGTRSGTSFRQLLSSPYVLPDGMEAGKEYDVSFETTSQYLGVFIIFKKDGSDISSLTLTSGQKITIPSTAEGIEISIRAFNGWPANSSATITFPKMYYTPEDGGLSKDVNDLKNETNDINKKISLIGSYEFSEPQKMSDLSTTTGKYWGSGGKQNASGYVAADNLLDVEPGEYVYLWDFGYLSDTSAAAIGMYDSNGGNAPGRVNFNDTAYVFNIETDTNNFIKSFKVLIPNGCKKVGLFYNSGNSFSGDPSFRIGEETGTVVFSEQVNDDITNIANDKSVNSAYFIKGKAKKLARTKKLCIIGAGQSNIDGRVPVADLPSGVSLPMSGLKYIKNTSTGVFGDSIPSGNWGFDVITCYHLINNLGSNNLYYIKWSKGGTAIDPSSTTDPDYWTADYEQLASLSNSLLLKFDKEIEKCNEVNPGDYEIGAMIWHQGEGDYSGFSATAPKNYYENFKKLVAFCRGITGNDCLPFICGTVSHNSAQYDPDVESAVLKLTSEDPYMWCVDMSDAELLDAYHFNAEWSEYLGEKVYDCLIDAGVVEGEKINPSKPT